MAQQHFDVMIADINAAQRQLEAASLVLQATLDTDYAAHGNLTRVAEAYADNARACVARWWELSDELLLKYVRAHKTQCSDGWCWQ